jgi:hypothetical protein
MFSPTYDAGGGAVSDSVDLDRVLRIPRRVWTDPQIETLQARWTAALRTPAGTQSLLPLQAQTLTEVVQWGGAFVGIPVGGGKTLTSALIPRVVPWASRTLLLLPAHLIQKTEPEFQAYRKDWILPSFIRIESYQTLGRVGAAKLLQAYEPEIIIADEADYLKNTGAAVTKRVVRYIREARAAGRKIVFVPMTGTPTGKSIRDFAHLIALALPNLNPTPTHFPTLDEWTRALDCDVPEHRRLAPGALMTLAGSTGVVLAEDEDEAAGARRAFQARLRQTPGVVLCKGEQLATPLVIRSTIVDLDDEQEQAFEKLRREWKTPDDIEAPDGAAVWRHARELATGFYQVWDPRPPDPWREARSAWAGTCQDIIAHNRRGLDSEEAVKIALRTDPTWDPAALATLEAWEAMEPTFVPNPVPVWISDAQVDWIVDWSKKHGPALIWTDRPALGARLAARGLAYYANEGIDARTGRRVESHDPSEGSIVLARRANDSGRNLQAWSRNLVVDVPSGGRGWEQMLGRTHRRGQKAPVVTVDVMLGCIEDLAAFWKAHGRSLYAKDMTGQSQKLLHANLDGFLDSEAAALFSGPQWRKTAPPVQG